MQMAQTGTHQAGFVRFWSTPNPQTQARAAVLADIDIDIPVHFQLKIGTIRVSARIPYAASISNAVPWTIH